MSRALEILWSTVDDVISKAQHVQVDYGGLHILGDELKRWVNDPAQLNLVAGRMLLPEGVGTDKDLFLYYLIADAVNFCYWYGAGDWRPGGSSSAKLKGLLSEVFVNFGNEKPSYQRRGCDYAKMIYQFQSLLLHERFSLIRERIIALEEIRSCQSLEKLFGAIFHSNLSDVSLSTCLDQLLMDLPGYGTDMFLKRASLFFMEIWKRRGWFPNSFNAKWGDQILRLPVPIDYHIPNVFRNEGCIHYNRRLAKRIEREEPILSGSRMEVEIRASAAEACRYLAEIVQVGPVEVDAFLFSKKNRANAINPIHLTVTTDY